MFDYLSLEQNISKNPFSHAIWQFLVEFTDAFDKMFSSMVELPIKNLSFQSIHPPSGKMVPTSLQSLTFYCPPQNSILCQLRGGIAQEIVNIISAYFLENIN